MEVYYSRIKVGILELAGIVAAVLVYVVVIKANPANTPMAARILGYCVLGIFAGAAVLGGFTLVALVLYQGPQLILSEEGIRQVSAIGVLPVSVPWSAVKWITTSEYAYASLAVPRRKDLVVTFVRSHRDHASAEISRVKSLRISSWLLRGSVDELHAQIIHRYAREIAEYHIHTR